MKSGMLVDIVAQPPVMEERELRISQLRVLPDTVYSCDQMSPVPPAFLVMAITTPTEEIMTTTWGC